MTSQLVFIHGRSQQHKDAGALKQEWITALRAGLAKNGLDLPIPESDIRFPYYGQTLFDLVEGDSDEDAADVIIRGTGDAGEDLKREFMASVAEEIREEKKITQEQLDEVLGSEVAIRGAQNWEWVQGILKAIDKYVPWASGASIAVATNDVYEYLKNPGIRDAIEGGVREALTPDVPSVVVAHSLGTVVGYVMLRRDGEKLGWNVPLFVTLGSPLAVKAIKRAVRPIGHPDCAKRWCNAMDERDVVSLYALDEHHFDVEPSILNHREVQNGTSNRHGISGYLDDALVSRWIYDALTAT